MAEIPQASWLLPASSRQRQPQASGMAEVAALAASDSERGSGGGAAEEAGQRGRVRKQLLWSFRQQHQQVVIVKPCLCVLEDVGWGRRLPTWQPRHALSVIPLSASQRANSPPTVVPARPRYGKSGLWVTTFKRKANEKDYCLVTVQFYIFIFFNHNPV